MESVKRARVESRYYGEKRVYGQKRIRSSESTREALPVNALIFDNGGSNIKIGYNHDDTPVLLPNQIMKAKSERKRAFISNQIEDCRDLSGLYFIMPNEQGYITKFDIQKNIWDYVFNKFPIEDNFVVMTQPVFNFKAIQEFTDEIFFEEYDVKHLHRATGTDLSYYQYINDFKGNNVPCIVVDSGFSFTHIVPYINGKKYAEGIVRMNVGGKLLTNYLKDILSYRQLHVMEETYVINHVKEDTCFMSLNFNADMQRARLTSEIVQNYVLPDFHNIRRGYVQETPTEDAENCQILRLNNERITIPEIINRPSIIPGFDSAGLGQCIAQAISKCPEQYHKALSNNVVLTGGNCQFPGFRERIEKETRIFLPCKNDLFVYQPDNPLVYSWQGGKAMACNRKSRSLFVSKQEYEENGTNYTYEKFNQYCKLDEAAPKKNVSSDNSSKFSYLQYWQKEGIDIGSKGVSSENNNDVQFKLEGENLEEFDGKHVTIEFEYEEPKVENIKIESESPVTTQPNNINNAPKLRTKPVTVPKPQTDDQSPAIVKPQILTTLPQSIFNTTFLPKLTYINPRVYKSSHGVKAGESFKEARIISLNNSMTLTDRSLLPSTNNAVLTKTVSSNSNNKMFNNAVLLPPNLISSKSLTFQIIPLKPDLMRPGNIIITKSSQ